MQASYQVFNGLAPADGQPKSLPYTFDFTNSATVTLDLLLEEIQGVIEFVQGIYVDNASNANPVTFVFPITKQRLIVPAFTQGIYPVIAPEATRIVATATIGMTVAVQLLNVPVAFQAWGPTTLNVANVSPAQGVFTDRSGSIAATGVSQLLAAINANRKLILIENPANAATSLFINYTAAASDNSGAAPYSYEILPGGYFPPSNVNVVSTEAVNITGTIGQKFIAKEM